MLQTQIQAVPVLSSLYPSLNLFSSFTFRRAPYRIFLLFLYIFTLLSSYIFSLRGVRSDNDTNFIVACIKIYQAKCPTSLRGEVEKHDCLWTFNPLGVSQWTAARNGRLVTRDELNILFQEAAAIINNTPLYESWNSLDEPLYISLIYSLWKMLQILRPSAIF